MSKKNVLCTCITILFLLSVLGCSFFGEDSDDDVSLKQEAKTILSQLKKVEMNLPVSLQAPSASSLSLRADVPYADLKEPKSQVYSQFIRMAEGLETRVNGIKDMIELVETDIIEETGLEAGEVYEETFPSTGNTLYVTYTFETGSDSKEYFVLEAAEFNTSEELVSGTYIEAYDTGNGKLKGQGMDISSSGTGSNINKMKIVFDMQNENYTGYNDFSSETEGDETGEVRVTKDTEDSNNGVFVSTKFIGEVFGQHTQVAWGNDKYGGMLGHVQSTENGTTNHNCFTEYFTMESGNAKIIFREKGVMSPDIMYEQINRGRTEDLASLNSYNAFDSSITSTPDNITLSYATGNPDAGFTLYVGEDSSGTEIKTETSRSGDEIFSLYWLDTNASSLVSGDAYYTFISEDSDSNNTYITFTKELEVPSTVTYLGNDGIYIQQMHPLVYVTGSWSDGDTIIQREGLDLDNDGTTDEYAYWVDDDNDGTRDTYSGDEAVSEKELIVWEYSDTYYDEAAQEEKTTDPIAWLFGEIPTVGSSDGTISYTYADDQTAVHEKMSEIGEVQYIDTISVEAFPVIETAWKDIKKSDFE